MANLPITEVPAHIFKVINVSLLTLKDRDISVPLQGYIIVQPNIQDRLENSFISVFGPESLMIFLSSALRVGSLLQLLVLGALCWLKTQWWRSVEI